jgi:hypothetical protein
MLAGAALIGLALPATAQAAKNWAVVESDGTLVRSNGVASASRLGLGTYLVRFNANVNTCAYVADPGRTANLSVAVPAVASVTRRTGNKKGVYVQTFNEATHAFVDEPFHLMAYCGTTARFAVVGKGGVIARGAHALSARRITKGEYNVHFDADVSNCVFTASVGSTGTTPLAAPGEISVSRGRKPHNVLVGTIGQSGNLANSSFHLAANCGSVAFRAVIRANGTLSRGAHVASSSNLGSSTYGVVFTQNVTTCAYVATIGTGGSALTTIPLTVTTASLNGVPNGVFVVVRKSDSTLPPHAFHLVVRC